MVLPKRYNAEIEVEMQKYWQKPEIYETVYKYDPEDQERPRFSIDTPPPFTSGELHMGHAYWCILNDTLARYKRMRGFNVLLPQGWDCQGLPTELKVQYKLGIPKEDRKRFLEGCKSYTTKMIKSMKEIMTRIGYRPDWEQFEYKTMDESYWRYVQLSLIKMYEKGMIYRGTFPNYWCWYCETSISQAEIGHVEREGFLSYIKFPLSGEEGKFVVIATTRPELIPACQGIFYHPDDPRYQHLEGKKAKIPLFGDEIPILTDRQVDPEFGTGIVMCCTYGDEQDIKWRQRHKLPVKICITKDGKMQNAGKYEGLTIKEARKAILEDLKEAGFLVKQEKMPHSVLSHTDRADCMRPVEFLETEQFFIKMKDYAEDIIQTSKRMKWIPEYFLQRLIEWCESIEWDWIISRQRVFGTPIPFWTCRGCGNLIPPRKEQLPVDTTKTSPPVDKCSKCGSKEIEGTTDTSDCWIDSSITPLIITRYYDGLADKYQPRPEALATVRQQGHDIIRTWHSYTTFRCFILTGLLSYLEVLVNGHVLGPDGKRMSKSKGNVVMPTDGIQEYGADSMRQTLLSMVIGSDFPYIWDITKYGKSFIQKFWSASRFLSSFLDGISPSGKVKALMPVDAWILSRLKEAIEKVTDAMDRYAFNDALKILQNFFWHEVCDHYLEAVKPVLRKEGEEKESSSFVLYRVILDSLKMLAPICPHLTEAVYLELFKEKEGSVSVHALEWLSPEDIEFDETEAEEGSIAIEVIAELRRAKAAEGIALGTTIEKAKVKVPENWVDVAKNLSETIKPVLRIEKLDISKGEELKAEF